MLLDTAAACILFWMVATFFSHRVALRRACYMRYIPLLAYACTLGRSPEGILSVFIVASLACVLQSTRSSGKKAALWWILAGVMVGIGCLLEARLSSSACGVWILLLALYPPFLAIDAGSDHRCRQSYSYCLMPWAYRNHELCGRWIFTSTASVGPC